MLQGMNLQTLASTVVRHASGKEDLVAPARALRFDRAENGVVLNVGDRPFSLTPNASSQVGEFLGIPRRFAQRLEKEVPDLLLTNFNTLMGRSDDRRMVRTLEGNARAFLSDSYRRIDNEIVFDGLFPTLQRLGAEIESANVSDDYLHIQAVFHRVEGEIRKGDVVRYGVAIRNSEVGKGALSISPLLYRLVCTNGMVVADQTRRKTHVGGSYLEGDSLNWIALSSETQQLKTKAVVAELGEYLDALGSPDHFQATLNRLREVADQPLPAEPQMVIESLGARYSLVKGETDSALLALAEGRDYSRWGLANAVTVLANTSKDYDRSVELETLGGRIMQMGAKDYAALARMPRAAEVEVLDA